MIKTFSKWAADQDISIDDLTQALEEVDKGLFEACLGGKIIKKRIRFAGQGKSKSGRTIICYQKDSMAIFVHGFAKNEKANLSPKELEVFKELAKILFSYSEADIHKAIANGVLIEVGACGNQ
jgi:hypothetical protein